MAESADQELENDKHEMEPLKKEDDSQDALFEDLIESVGNYGPFQKRTNIIFNCLFVTILIMPVVNIFLVLTVPDHRCHVPGQENTNYSLEEWQQRMLPKTIDPKTQQDSLSSCTMFINGTNETAACTSGYDYDRRWYVSTIATDNDWVCDRGLYVSNVFVAISVGDTFGLFIFGQLGDRIGRKPVYYISLSLLLLGHILIIFTAHNYALFMALVFLSSTGSGTIYQISLVVGLEITAASKRARVSMIQNTAGVAGYCILPMLQWWLGGWKYVMLATTLPGAVVFFVYKLLPESPRWLASRGKIEESAKVLKEIAKVNGKQVPSDMYQTLAKMAAKKEKTYGYFSLFTNSTLAKNTIKKIVCSTVSILGFSSMFLNTPYMGGNPFLNFVWMSLVELPGLVLGRYLSDNIGRRWTHAGSRAVVVVFSALVIISYGVSTWLTLALVIGMKLSHTIAYYSMYLQAMEMFPTCLRQTGLTIGAIVASIFGVLSPYIIYLGTNIDGRLPYVAILALSALGSTCAALLPETLNQKLPETLEDTKNFGKKQQFWSFNKSRL